jgi:hypothetical protein
MKVEWLHLNITNKLSPISEGVTKIWINSQPCKGINLTTWHTQAGGHHEWQQFTTWPKSQAGSYLALVSSSSCMPRWTHRGWPERYPIIHLWSEVRYRPTHRYTKLLSLGIPYVLYALVQFNCLFIRAQPTWALIDTGGGYHLGASNIRSDHSPCFPSSIIHFPLIAPPDLQLCHSINYSCSQHSTLEPRYKRPKSRKWSLPLDFYQNSIH